MGARQKRKLRPGVKIVGIVLLYSFMMGCVSYAVYYGYRHMHTSSYFSIKRIVFDGTSVRTEPALRKIFADVTNKNLLNLDLRTYQEKALKHHWISSITLHRELPDTLRVRLTERSPVGLCHFQGEIHLFDEEGCIIDDLEGGEMALDTPILRGIRKERVAEDLLFGFHFLNELKAESQVFWSQMEEIDIEDRENIVVYSSLIHAPVYLGQAPIPGNLSRFLSIVDYLNQNYPELEYIELGVPKQVVIMPRGGSW